MWSCVPYRVYSGFLPCSIRYINATTPSRNFGRLFPRPPPTMALLTFAALFFSFDFAVIGAGLLIHAFVASNNQVDHLRTAIPKGTVLNVDRDGEKHSSIFHIVLRSPFTAQISPTPEGCQSRCKHSSSPSQSLPPTPSSSVRKLAQRSSPSSLRFSPLHHFASYPSRSPLR